MAEKKPYLTVNYETMTFTVNDAVKPTAQDEEDIARYLRAGYKMRHKSVKRTERATKNALTDEVILKALEADADALEVYKNIKTDNSKGANGTRNGGFFKAKSWYEKKYQTGEWKKEQEDKKTKK